MLIRAMEHTDAAADAVARIFDSATASKLFLVTSEITLGEVLAGPFRLDDALLAQAYEKLLMDSEIFALVPINRDILVSAARLRSQRTLTLPDAIHAATAISTACDHMLTFDRDFEGCGNFTVIGPGDPRLESL
jgi:predicted nucleic acid-binding protein